MSNSKLNASIEAIEYIKPKIDMNSIIGVGTGSTVNYFIEELAKIKHIFKGAVSSSEASTQLFCLLYTSPSPRDQRGSRMPSSA